MTPEREAQLRELIEHAEYSRSAYLVVNEGKNPGPLVQHILEQRERERQSQK